MEAAQEQNPKRRAMIKTRVPKTPVTINGQIPRPQAMLKARTSSYVSTVRSPVHKGQAFKGRTLWFRVIRAQAPRETMQGVEPIRSPTIQKMMLNDHQIHHRQQTRGQRQRSNGLALRSSLGNHHSTRSPSLASSFPGVVQSPPMVSNTL